MTSYRKKVASVQSVTTEREVLRVEKHYKSGAALVTLTIERYTAIHVFLECGHSRQQHNGMRDITKAKALDCWECERMDRATPNVKLSERPTPNEDTKK